MRLEVMFDTDEVYGYTFTDEKWRDHFERVWSEAGYEVERVKQP